MSRKIEATKGARSDMVSEKDVCRDGYEVREIFLQNAEDDNVLCDDILEFKMPRSKRPFRITSGLFQRIKNGLPVRLDGAGKGLFNRP
jgi:hypothetical protein